MGGCERGGWRYTLHCGHGGWREVEGGGKGEARLNRKLPWQTITITVGFKTGSFAPSPGRTRHEHARQKAAADERLCMDMVGGERWKRRGASDPKIAIAKSGSRRAFVLVHCRCLLMMGRFNAAENRHGKKRQWMSFNAHPLPLLLYLCCVDLVETAKSHSPKIAIAKMGDG